MEEKLAAKEREFFAAITAGIGTNGTNGKCPVFGLEDALAAIRDINGTSKTPKADALKKRIQRAEIPGVLREIDRGRWMLTATGQTGHERDNG